MATTTHSQFPPTEQFKTGVEPEIVRNYDRELVLEDRNLLVARKVTEFLKRTGRFDKTIVFCEDIDHAERMRTLLVNANADLVARNGKYVMRITGDSEEGKLELDNFIDPESAYSTGSVKYSHCDVVSSLICSELQRIQSQMRIGAPGAMNHIIIGRKKAVIFADHLDWMSFIG